MPGSMTEGGRLAVVAILLFFLYSATIFGQHIKENVEVYLFSNGEIRVVHNIEVSGIEPIVVRTIGAPYLMIITDSKGNPLLYNYSDGVIQVLPVPGEAINITYFSKLHSNNSVYTLTIPSFNQSTRLYIADTYILLDTSIFPDNIVAENNWTILVYNRLEENLTVHVFEVGERTQKHGQEVGHGSQENWYFYPLIAVTAIVVASLSVYFYKARKHSGAILTEEDEMIIDYIRRVGGRVYLKELRQALELPSTTAWRRVKRLEKMGIVETHRTPAGLMILLKK